MKNWTGNEYDNIIQGLVAIDMKKDDKLLGRAIESMNKMWKEIDEVLSVTWYNKEKVKLWREYLKEKKETKNLTEK